MNDTFGGEFNATQTATSSAVSEQKPEGIAPVFLKQVKDSVEGNFQMFDMTFGMVSCAAIIRSIDTSSTKITYTLEDFSGQIEAHYWLEEGDSLKAPDVMINNYAKVFGSVRSQGGTKTLMIFRMFTITDPNEICTHILETLNARYKAEDFALKNVGNGKEFSDFGGAASKGSSSNFGIENSDTLGLQGKTLAVYQAIKNRMNEEGISRQELLKKFAHMASKELNNTLDFLTSEGHIYSSIDADHFVSTE